MSKKQKKTRCLCYQPTGQGFEPHCAIVCAQCYYWHRCEVNEDVLNSLPRHVRRDFIVTVNMQKNLETKQLSLYSL